MGHFRDGRRSVQRLLQSARLGDRAGASPDSVCSTALSWIPCQPVCGGRGLSSVQQMEKTRLFREVVNAPWFNDGLDDKDVD